MFSRNEETIGALIKMTLKDFLIKHGKDLGLEGSDKAFIQFAIMIIDNSFRTDETCILELKEELK